MEILIIVLYAIIAIVIFISKHFIEEKVKMEKDKGTTSLDAKIYECIQQQAAEKNIVYKDGPKY